jgi:hypothetical protein
MIAACRRACETWLLTHSRGKSVREATPSAQAMASSRSLYKALVPRGGSAVPTAVELVFELGLLAVADVPWAASG